MTTLALSGRFTGAAAASNPLIFAVILLSRRIARRLRIRADQRRLQAMPDYLLADIGISRGEIGGATEFGRSHRLGPSYRI